MTNPNRILRSLAGLQQSGVLNASLARQLMLLSAGRFTIQVLMAGQAAEAIGVNIPLWHLAAAMPFVIIACVIVVTPGGLGVNELSYATTLHMFGTPLNVFVPPLVFMRVTLFPPAPAHSDSQIAPS